MCMPPRVNVKLGFESRGEDGIEQGKTTQRIIRPQDWIIWRPRSLFSNRSTTLIGIRRSDWIATHGRSITKLCLKANFGCPFGSSGLGTSIKVTSLGLLFPL
eukprot:Gb_36174 [translate_table: standard]